MPMLSGLTMALFTSNFIAWVINLPFFNSKALVGIFFADSLKFLNKIFKSPLVLPVNNILFWF